jgi:uncharacterized protein
MKLLMWLALVVLVVFAVRKKGQKISFPTAQGGAEPAPPRPDPVQIEAEAMVCCDICQMYVPSSEAIRKGQKTYCCIAHAEQAVQAD